ncbi:MAG: hypothetical protein ACREM8_10535 [Vulcanimicrobiaceae bacterium]
MSRRRLRLVGVAAVAGLFGLAGYAIDGPYVAAMAAVAAPAVAEGSFAGVDLIAIACVLLLIGLLKGVRYTFEQLGAVFKSIPLIGDSIGGWFDDLIHNTIIEWCEIGIADLEGGWGLLMRGLEWSIREFVRAVHYAITATESGLSWLERVGLEGLISAAVGPIVRNLRDIINLTETYAPRAVRAAEREALKALTAAEASTVKHVASEARALEARVATVEKQVAAAIGVAVGEIPIAERDIAGRLAELERLLGAGALGGILAYLPRVLARVDTVAAETTTAIEESGLSNRLCRPKFKGICGVPLQSWLNLLADLALLEVGLNFRELYKLAEQGVAEFLPEIKKVI